MRDTWPDLDFNGQSLKDVFQHRPPRIFSMMKVGRQLLGAALLFMGLLVVYQLDSPWARDLQEGFRYYLADSDSDMTPALEAMVRDGTWLDAYDRQVFEQWQAGSQAVNARVPQPSVPASGKLSRGFGKVLSPVDGGQRTHNGIDISAPVGSPVRAVLPGTVIRVASQQDLGRLVAIRHQDSLITVYANLSEVLVSAGGKVKQGQVIAKVGQGGEPGSSHLHFEVEQGGRYLDPWTFLQPSGPV